jgi:integrase/recombinase XerD
MSCIRQELDRYLAIRRSLGYDLGTTARLLRRFAAFAETQGAEHVNTDLFLKWQASFGQASHQTWAARLGMVRLFAQWLHGLDPTHEVPARGLIPHRVRRSRPYIYSAEEIANIVAAAAELPSVHGLRGLICSILFGLLATTGIRISEAFALDPRCRPRDRRAYDPVGQARQGPAGADRQQRDAAPERLRRRTQPAARLFATPLLCR